MLTHHHICTSLPPAMASRTPGPTTQPVAYTWEWGSPNRLKNSALGLDNKLLLVRAVLQNVLLAFADLGTILDLMRKGIKF